MWVATPSDWEKMAVTWDGSTKLIKFSQYTTWLPKKLNWFSNYWPLEMFKNISFMLFRIYYSEMATSSLENCVVKRWCISGEAFRKRKPEKIAPDTLSTDIQRTLEKDMPGVLFILLPPGLSRRFPLLLFSYMQREFHVSLWWSCWANAHNKKLEKMDKTQKQMNK